MSLAASTIDAARLPPAELLGSAFQGLRSRRLWAALSALGIAIGIGAMVAVVSVSASAQANLLAEIDALGTNLLTVTPGQTFTGANEVLPDPSVAMIAHMRNIESDAAVYQLAHANVYRTPFVPALRRPEGSPSTLPAKTCLRASSIASGRFLDAVVRPLSRRSCSAPRRRACWGYTGRRPPARLPRQHLVLRCRDPQAGAAGPRARLRRSSSRCPSPRACSRSPAPPRSTFGPMSRRDQVANLLAATADPQKADGVQVCRPPMPSRPAPPLRGSSRRCCLAWVPLPCWSARSASPTSW